MIAVILAAGRGTRMKSDLPKVMHRVGGVPMVERVARLALAAGARELAVVVGWGRELVEAHLRQALPEAPLSFPIQENMKGTGDAVRCSRAAWQQGDEEVVVLCGDVPNVPPDVVRGLVRERAARGAALAFVTALAPEGTTYGRIVRDEKGDVRAIVEYKDADEATRAIREVNAGIYVFSSAFLRAHIDGLSDDNAQGELYLTDLIGVAVERQVGCVALLAPDIEALEGVNTPEDLARAEATAARWQGQE